VGLGAVAALLAILGRPVGAVLCVIAATLVVQAARLAPERLARVEARIVTAVGGVVGTVLLFPVHLLLSFFGLLSRGLGVDPLRAVADWTPVERRLRPRRSSSDDRRPGHGQGMTWRLALALVAVGAAAATWLPGLFDEEQDQIPSALRGDDGYDDADAPALADAEWLPEASVEFTEAVTEGGTYVPFVGFAMQDHVGRYVNVTDRERRSYEAQVTTGEPLDVWFFGGSTMFGFSAQRDLHTIPSEVVRLAEDDGIQIRAHNFGGPGMVNFQETILFAQLLLATEPPDLVVFYDGINDRSLQLLHAYAGTGRVGEVSDLSAHAFRQALGGEVTGNVDPPPPIGDLPALGPPPPPISDTIDAVIDVYEEGITLSRRLAIGDGVPVRHFWQPDLFSRRELAPGEQAILEPLHLDARRYGALREIDTATRDRLPEDVVDLGDAFDVTDEAVLTDQVHTNELGAHLVAAAMYEHLRADLERAADQ
jgi:hypothetical protein